MPEGPPLEPITQGRFTWEFDDGSTYSDAIVLPRDEFSALTDRELQTLKQERAESWKATVDAARDYVPTDDEQKAERRERREELEARRDQTDADLAAVDAEIAQEK